MKKLLLLSLCGLCFVTLGGCYENSLKSPIETTLSSESIGTVVQNKTILTGMSGSFAEWNSLTSIKLTPEVASELNGSCFEVWDTTIDNSIIYLNVMLCNSTERVGYAVVLYNSGNVYNKIYEGQDSIPTEIRSKYNIPDAFHD